MAASASLLLCLSPLLGRAEKQGASRENQEQVPAPLSTAQLALENQNPDEAVRIASKYLENHPENTRARVLLGQAYVMKGQTDHAEEEFQTALKGAPENYVALSTLGELYSRQGQLDKAEPLLGRAVKASHGIPQIRMEWALVLARLHEYKKAQSALSGLLPPDTTDDRMRFYRLKGSVALGLGDADAAAREMEKALALKPEDDALILATATAELQSGNWKRTAELTKPVFAKTREPAVGMLLLEAEIGAKADAGPTLTSIRTATMNTPEETEVRQQLAEMLVSHGKYSEAIEDFLRVVELNPHRPNFYFNLALAQFRAGRLDDAWASATKSKELSDSADLEDLLGDIEEARGDNLAAVKSYQAAVALVPNEEKYRLSLALELLRHKSFDAARVVLQQAEGLRPNSWRVQFARGMLEYFEGNEEDATPLLLRAANLSPEPAIALRYVGDIQMDRAAGPDPSVLIDLCKYADQHPKEALMQYYCGALLFKRDYTSEDKTKMPDILRRLNASVSQLPNDPAPHCQLGRAYR